MRAFSKGFLGCTAILLGAAPAAGAQTILQDPRPAAATAAEPATATMVDPNATPILERAPSSVSRFPQRAKVPPTIAGVPERIAWGDEVTITGANFISPTVELYAPVLGSSGGVFHYSLKPYQATSESFKVLIQRGVVGSANPLMRLKVTTPYGSDTSKTQLRLEFDPRIDTIIVGGAWRQAGTPQMWWQRVIWVRGRNLYDWESASVGSTYVPVTDVWATENNGMVAQINVPRSCSGQGNVTITFSPNRHPPSGPVTGQRVTCLPNDQISSP